MKTLVSVLSKNCRLQQSKAVAFLLFFIMIRHTIFCQTLWLAPAGQSWLVIGNWTGNTVPSATGIAQFGIAPTGSVTGIGINMNNPTNNGPNNQAVGAIEITSARKVNLKIGNSSTSMPGTLTLNGAVVNGITDVVLRNNSSGLLTIDTSQALGNNIMQVALNDAADNKIFIDSSGGISINTVLKGAGQKLSVYGSGSGILQLKAANTYTGITAVNGSTLQLNKTGGGTLPATNDIVVNSGGALKISTHQTLHDITLNAGAVITIDEGVILTVSGTFFCNGGNIAGGGVIAYNNNASLSYGGPGPQITSDAEFPGTSGPSHVVINNYSGVSLHAARTISGLLTLSAGNFILGGNDFTSSGTNGLATASTHVVTNAKGKLVITNIGIAEKLFPIGANTSTINPVIIANGNNADYGAKVETGFPIPITDPAKAVNRTWIIQSLTTASAKVDVSFLYFAGDGNKAFNYAAPVDHGIYLPFGFGWNINQTGLPQNGAYRVDTKVSSFLAATDLPMVIGNLGAVLNPRSPIDLFVQKINTAVFLNWKANTPAATAKVEIERSGDGNHFISISDAGGNITSYKDAAMLPGVNYYRITSAANGKIVYSNIERAYNNITTFNLQPCPVNTAGVLQFAVVKKMQLRFVVTDILGRQVQQKTCDAMAGNNRLEMDFSALAAGLYQLTAYAAGERAATLRFIKQ